MLAGSGPTALADRLVTRMASRFTLPLLLLLALGAASSLAAPRRLAATSVVLGTDAELADQAPVVAEATVIAQEPAAFTSGMPTTDYRLLVERVLKGRVAGGMLRLRVLGGPGPDGLTLKIWGAPELRAGETGPL